jgi:hypothetical protein
MPKATQVRAEPTPGKVWKCVQCGKETSKPYGFVKHGEAVTCKAECDRAYYRTIQDRRNTDV